MRVCHISTVHPATDHRILDKECRSLAKAGYDVHLIARGKREFEDEGVRIYPFPDYSSRLKRATTGVSRIVSEALKLQPDVVHFHDPEILWAVPRLKRHGVRVIYDAHEHLPKQVRTKPWIRPGLLRRVALWSVAAYEMYFAARADRVISVTPEIVERFPSSKSRLVRNFPALTEAPSSTEAPPHDGVIRSIYVGGLSRIRGIREMVEAFRELGDTHALHLLGPWESNSYRDECLDNAPANVTYGGLLSPREVPPHIRRAHIGLAMLHPAQNYLMSYPVKAFEYMRECLPIVMSDFPYWRRLFGDCALFADPGSPSEIASAIRTLGADVDLRRQLGRNGRHLVEREYNWQHEERRLLELYAGLTHPSS